MMTMIFQYVQRKIRKSNGFHVEIHVPKLFMSVRAALKCAPTLSGWPSTSLVAAGSTQPAHGLTFRWGLRSRPTEHEGDTKGLGAEAFWSCFRTLWTWILGCVWMCLPRKQGFKTLEPEEMLEDAKSDPLDMRGFTARFRL